MRFIFFSSLLKHDLCVRAYDMRYRCCATTRKGKEIVASVWSVMHLMRSPVRWYDFDSIRTWRMRICGEMNCRMWPLHHEKNENFLARSRGTQYHLLFVDVSFTLAMDSTFFLLVFDASQFSASLIEIIAADDECFCFHCFVFSLFLKLVVIALCKYKVFCFHCSAGI